jgi:uncharacterized membrane protein (UPF0127 family)
VNRETKSWKNQLTIAAALLVVIAFWLFRTLNNQQTSKPASWSPTSAQARLPTVKLYLGAGELVTEMARRPAEIMTGMMFRTNMGPNEAMLFILPVPQQASFYMRNTLIPLSCGYIDEEGTILEIHDMKPKDETLILSATPNIRFVLEVNRGWFETNHVGAGTVIGTDKGPLSSLLRTAN